MGFETGILFAFLALIFWGFGDFLIQKSTRKFGDWETLFVISIFGTIILFPFIFKDLASLFPFNREFWILIGVSLIILFAAILDFEALRKFKFNKFNFNIFNCSWIKLGRNQVLSSV